LKMLTISKFIFTIDKRRNLPFSKYLDYVTPKVKSPVVSTLFIVLLALLMMIFFDPDHLSDLCVFTVYCFYLLAFFGIFILRHKNKGPRPFSTPLYPLVPIIAIAGGIFVLVREVMNDPAGVILFIGIVIVGLPILYIVKRMDQRRMH